MTKGERELRKLLKRWPGVTIASNGKSGYVLVAPNGRRHAVGGLQSGLHDTHKIERFLKG